MYTQRKKEILFSASQFNRFTSKESSFSNEFVSSSEFGRQKCMYKGTEGVFIILKDYGRTTK